MVNWKTMPILRVLTTGIAIDQPGITYGPRIQNHHEFIWVMEGEGKVSFDNRTFRVHEGTILFRKPGVKDYYEWSVKRPTMHAFVHFDLDPSSQKLVSTGLPSSRMMPSNDILRPLFSYLLKIDEHKEPLRSEIMASTLKLMVTIYSLGLLVGKTQPAIRLPGAVEQVMEIIRENTEKTPPTALHLKDLTQAANTTPESLCRQFKKTFGLGPLEYAKLARLNRVVKQLLHSSLRIKEIALSTGFYDAYHLSRRFKQVYGLSPKKFRESPRREWLALHNPMLRITYRRKPDFLKEASPAKLKNKRLNLN